jgi:hypothetical protein
MPEIPFTQFLRPDGRRAQVAIDRPPEIAALAEKIIAAGYRFECEHLTTGHASITISNDDEDRAIEVVMNGPQVPAAVDRLITRFAATLETGEHHGS